MPTAIPKLVHKPALVPPVTLCRVTTTKSGPGEATANKWAIAIIRNSVQYICQLGAASKGLERKFTGPDL